MNQIYCEQKRAKHIEPEIMRSDLLTNIFGVARFPNEQQIGFCHFAVLMLSFIQIDSEADTTPLGCC